MAAPPALFEDLPDADDNSHESSDEDFNPTAVVASEESSSSSEEEEAPAKPKGKSAPRKRKRKAPVPDELDSGDEVTIEAARKRKAKRRRGDKGGDVDDLLILSDDEGGEGGLVKTRAQRKVEQIERRPLAGTEGATVDVDALWAQMTAAPLRAVSVPSYKAPEKELTNAREVTTNGASAPMEVDSETDLVSIRKIYTFAGQRTTEEKEVPRNSLEQYLSDGWKTIGAPVEVPTGTDGKPDAVQPDSPHSNVRRPLRRPSRFDPNPTGYVRTLPPEHQLSWPRKAPTNDIPDQENVSAADAAKAARPEKAQKLNVVDKSRLDWSGYVEKEGIAEELDVHKKTKTAYLGRMEFLAGVEAKQNEERLRMKTAATSATS